LPDPDPPAGGQGDFFLLKSIPSSTGVEVPSLYHVDLPHDIPARAGPISQNLNLIQNLALRRARIKATKRAQTLIRQLADRVILIYKKSR